MNPRYSPQALEDFCKALLVASGVPESEALIVSSVLVDTSLEGIDTHGISRLPIYLSCLLNGRINPKPSIQKKFNDAVAVVDGDNGLGQLVAYRSMALAVDLAKVYGLGFVTVKNSNHFGAASTYCKMAAHEGMIGQAYTNSPCGIPPWGGKNPYFGTNPISYGFPNGDQPVVVDMSSSIIARGKIILAAKEGRSIPKGWAIDQYGNSTTDAEAALQGAVLPVGGPKGYALALAAEVMSGIISGSKYGTHVGWIYDDSLEPVNIGHSFFAIDISRLMPLRDYAQRMTDMIGEIKSVPRADEVDAIRIPGERRQSIAEERKKDGIPINEGLLQELNELAVKFDLLILE
ncbi:Ldh family oxidoreductase [Desulfosporosinus shakirovi]|uniref:Ldh family oxidoreductase n=1 Tax=Desulfosporosinus shakirovi TaxID=2885154 RepID=UPI001E64B9EA|nr:Ldh family oxidoreductase [Desulfosporosinus sp. SRJS8]MCB8814208.1 Ldh family oxidoreductase [Desulfosporosinus sp. SRJS8]